MTLRLTTLSLGLLALTSALPAMADEVNDRFTLRLGAMSADGNGTLRGSGDLLGQNVNFDEDFDFGKDEWSPRVDGVWHISPRNRLVFDYFQYKKDNRQTLGEGLSFDDTTIPAGSYAQLDTRFQLASLIYDFSVVESEAFSAGLQIGAEWAKIDAKLTAEAGDLGSYRGTEKEDGVAPVVGARLTFKPGERWLINIQGQYLDAEWGSFDYKGKIKRANAIAEYRFTDNFGIFAGYDWFKINYEEEGRDATGGLDLEFKGPMAGVTFAF